MRLTTFLIMFLACFCAKIASAQTISVANENQNIVYMGLSNPISVVAAGYPCQDIFVKTDNGKLTRVKDCYYDLIPDTMGLANIKVYSRKNARGIFLGKSILRVRKIPLPVAIVAGRHGGSVPANVLRAQVGVAAHYSEICGNGSVTSFTICFIKRSGNWLEMTTNAGCYFSVEMKKMIASVEPGDRLFFFNIKADGPGIEGMDLESFVLTVK